MGQSAVLVAPDTVAGGGITYSELVGMALPGFAVVDGRLVVEADVALPHIEGNDFTVTALAPVAVDAIEALPLLLDGAPHLALLIELGAVSDSLGPVQALAVFDVSGGPVLVDVKDVGFDRLSGFAQPARLTVGRGHDLLLVHNSHGNAGQFYDATTIVDVVDGEIRMVDMVMTLSDMTCAGTRTQSLDFAAAAPDGPGKGDFSVTVVDEQRPGEDACDGIVAHDAGETTYSVTYRWREEAGLYEADGDGWAALEALNAQRY